MQSSSTDNMKGNQVQILHVCICHSPAVRRDRPCICVNAVTGALKSYSQMHAYGCFCRPSTSVDYSNVLTLLE